MNNQTNNIGKNNEEKNNENGMVLEDIKTDKVNIKNENPSKFMISNENEDEEEVEGKVINVGRNNTKALLESRDLQTSNESRNQTKNLLKFNYEKKIKKDRKDKRNILGNLSQMKEENESKNLFENKDNLLKPINSIANSLEDKSVSSISVKSNPFMNMPKKSDEIPQEEPIDLANFKFEKKKLNKEQKLSGVGMSDQMKNMMANFHAEMRKDILKPALKNFRNKIQAKKENEKK